MSKADVAGAKAMLPLNSIRVFVEAARQLSFSRAARSLGMTQSGVSHHVSALEKYLGQRLFVRSGACVELTDTGRLYFDNVHEAMSTVELATRQIVPPPDAGLRLVVRTSLPTFAMTVLIPSLPQFNVQPPVTVDVVTSLSPPAFGERFDVLITRDLVIDDNAHWHLANERLVCVAAPALCLRYARQPLSAWPFLVAKSRPDVLSAWVGQQPLAARDIRVVATFEHFFLALSAAIGGLGFLVVPELLVREPLRQRHLAETATPAVRGDASHKAYVNPESSAPDAAKAFCRWLSAALKNDGGTRDTPLTEGV